MERAFDALEKLSNLAERNVRFHISVSAGSGSGFGWPMKGIYIREPVIDKPKEYSISVEPVFLNEDQIGNIFQTICNSILLQHFSLFYKL